MSWRNRAICPTFGNPDLWYPTELTPPEDILLAQGLCLGCPARKMCKVKGESEPYGIWGGELKGLCESEA